MALIDIPVFLIGCGLGAWLGVRFGGKLLSWYHGTEAFAQKLEAQAAKIEGQAASLKAKAAAVRAAIGPAKAA